MKFDLNTADVDRIVDGLELLAMHHDKASMTRAREKCLELRSKVIKQQLEQPHESLAPVPSEGRNVDAG